MLVKERIEQDSKHWEQKRIEERWDRGVSRVSLEGFTMMIMHGAAPGTPVAWICQTRVQVQRPCEVHSTVLIVRGKMNFLAGHLLWVGGQTGAGGHKHLGLTSLPAGGRCQGQLGRLIEHAQTCVGSSHLLAPPPQVRKHVSHARCVVVSPQHPAGTLSLHHLNARDICLGVGVPHTWSTLQFGSDVTLISSGSRLNIKTVLSTYGNFHVKDKTAVRTSYL